MLPTQKGTQTEQACCEYLSRAGLRLVEKNYRCKPGEIDLVMRQGDTLVFIEVRFRRSERFGGALYSVDHRKQRRMIAAAQHYLQRHRIRTPSRIDVVAMTATADGDYRFEWIQDAVSAD